MQLPSRRKKRAPKSIEKLLSPSNFPLNPAQYYALPFTRAG
jgi:hypothetical protein